MQDDRGSTVPRRQLGRCLRDLREKSGSTVQAAARALEWSTAKLWRIETGQVPMRTHDVATMCRIYRATPEITEALTGLARETRARGWWHSYGDAVPEWFSLYVGLEAAATRVRQYEPELVPGLLQTKAYTRAFIRIECPHLTDAELDRMVAVKMHRQRLLTRLLPEPPRLEVLLSEAVLRRPIADRAAMAGQLTHLVETVQRLPHVTVRVLPLAAGPTRASIGGPFAMLDFAGGEPTTIYCEGPTGALYLDKPAEATTYEAIWDSVATLAVDPQESMDIIASFAKEYDHD
ncbi:helix-turn-helix transcriptional regulator [Micromonospora sp. CPCC 206060]|uniref:helix-turn-helix domain-containing protein n=1 Tax=Micromonospora sp. CPCC 206060 TaxID=3122406 RepID=UPI002FF4119C